MTHAYETQFDLVVVGGGTAGLVTATRAAELGLRTALLEKGEEERYPCNARFSGGILHAAFHDVQRPEDELRAILGKSTQNTADPALVETVAKDGRRLLAWLRAHDVRFMQFSWQEAHRWGMAPPRPVAPGLEWKGRGPDVMLRTLTDRFKTAGGTVRLGARAVDLVMESGTIAGIDVLDPGGNRFAIAAKAVALCDGGYQANLDLLRAHIGPNPEALLQRGAATGTGEGIAMAMRVGAATRNLHRFYGHLHGRRALTNPDVWPYPELDSVAAASIIVTPDGKRFVNEGLGGMAITNALAALPDPASATIITDAAAWEGPGRSARIPANPFLEKFGGEVIGADTLEELAQRAAIDAGGLARTIADYNSSIEQGGGQSLVPPRTAQKTKPWPVARAPYLAIPVCVGITYTMGGIAIDGEGRVLDTTGMPIQGLYAAGTTTAGLEGGGEQVGYVGGLIKSVFGLRAAEDLAARMGPNAARASR